MEGSLNIFNHQTNIDIENRVLVYGLRDLAGDLSGMAMLIMLENIKQRIIKNAKKGRATWLYVDEFHVLLGKPFSRDYLIALWKQVRKLGGLLYRNHAECYRGIKRSDDFHACFK